MLKRLAVALTAFATLFVSALYAEAAKSDKWLIYWYVCGTDIETTRIAFQPGTDLMTGEMGLAEPDRRPSDATRCIREVEKATLSPDVRIFMQAGGTYIWGHEKFRDLNAKIQTNIAENVPTAVFSKNEVRVGQWYLSKNNSGTVAKPAENGKIGRYVYDKVHRNWHPNELLSASATQNTKTDMGSKEGLISFLEAGQKLERELYPEGNVRRILIFVDHGGGIGGVCYDEYTKNMLSLNEIQDAFKSVQGGWNNPAEKPFEVVAFDACIMSVYETAVAIQDSANYMVASQESTMGKVMFGYTDLLNELSKKTSMSGKELGKVICNITWEDSKVTDKEFGINSNVVFTETVIDLSDKKMDALKAAYENFGEAALKVAEKNSEDVADTFIRFKRAADASERFSIIGGGTPNMVDLKNFAVNLKSTFPELKKESNALVKAVDNAVIYNKRGDAFKRGGGLSIYYPHDLISSADYINYYNDVTKKLSSPDSSAKLYAYLFNGVTKNLQLTDRGWNIPADSVFDLSRLETVEVAIDEDKKTATIELDEDERQGVERIRYQVLYFMPRNGSSDKFDTVLFGSDSEIAENKKDGTFTVSFNDKKWITLDGEPLYVQVVADSTRKDKNGKKIGGNDICLAPILLNGRPYKLFFSRSYPGAKVTVIGAVENTDGAVTLPSGELESFKKGDVVIPLYYLLKPELVEEYSEKYTSPKNMTDAEKMELVERLTIGGKKIVIGDKPKFETATLTNGVFCYVFEFVNPFNARLNVYTEEGAICKIKNGKIVKVIHSDDFTCLQDLE